MLFGLVFMTFVLVVFGTTACLYNIKFMRFLFFSRKVTTKLDRKSRSTPDIIILEPELTFKCPETKMGNISVAAHRCLSALS